MFNGLHVFVSAAAEVPRESLPAARGPVKTGAKIQTFPDRARVFVKYFFKFHGGGVNIRHL